MKIRFSYDMSSEQSAADVAIMDVRRRFPYCKIKRPEPKQGEKHAHVYVTIPEPPAPKNPFFD